MLGGGTARHIARTATPGGLTRRWLCAGIGRSDDPGPENLGELSELDVMAVLGIMQHDFNVDADRTYLIGQSMGGGGTGPTQPLTAGPPTP